MQREQILELLRTIILAFIIAFVINLFRIAVFENGDFTRLISPFGDYRNNIQARRSTQEVTQTTELNSPQINTFSGENIIEIPLENPMDLNGYKKEQVLTVRKRAVRTSPIFSDMYYQPSSSVFNIVDNLPWISLEGALHFNKIPVEKRIQGFSRESVGILNPELLYYVSTMENEDAEDTNFKALYEDFYFIPYKLTYNTKTNTITAYIKNKTKQGNYQPICLSDSNAHDLGYSYAYMDMSSNVGFYSDPKYSRNTLKSNIQNVTGYYTRGSVCGVTGGCNNYAPYWQYYNQFYLRQIPARFNIKLWKTRPSSPAQQADINFEMVFE